MALMYNDESLVNGFLTKMKLSVRLMKSSSLMKLLGMSEKTCLVVKFRRPMKSLDFQKVLSIEVLAVFIRRMMLHVSNARQIRHVLEPSGRSNLELIEVRHWLRLSPHVQHTLFGTHPIR